MPNYFPTVLQNSVRHWQIAGIVYLLQTGLAITLGMQVHGVLQTSIGSSLELNRLMSGYDHTVMTDFLKVHGASITPLIGQLRWLLLVWLAFSVFLHGGLIHCAAIPTKPKISDFWLGGSRHYLSFLQVSGVMLMLALLWTSMLWLPVLMSLQWSLEYFSSEIISVWAVVLISVVYLAGLAVIYLWSILVRMDIIRENNSLSRALVKGLKMLFEQKMPLVKLFSGYALLQFLLIALYWSLDALIGMRSPTGIALLFLAQQIFVYLRILLQSGLYRTISLRF